MTAPRLLGCVLGFIPALTIAACGSSSSQSAASRVVTTSATHTTHTTHTTRTSTTTSSSCGIERWNVKTMTDSAANRVNLTPTPSTIQALAALKAPANPTSRAAPAETQTYRVSGTITFAKQEADSDMHLVLKDAAGETLIVEAPKPACAAGSRVLAQMTAVRQAIDQRFAATADRPYAPGVSYAVNVPAVVTGVGFFDRIHGQTGVAANGIELHPLTAITFGP